MWKVVAKKEGQLLLSDGSDAKWVHPEGVEEVMEYSNWSQYFMSFDFRPPDNWSGLYRA